MSCYSPWVPSGGSAKRPLACGRCLGCKMDYSRQWAIRCMHEARMHKRNEFVTLTYKNAPVNLEPMDYKRFQRRLVHHFGSVRYFMGGEYGESGGRAHFHALLFGVSFEDRRYFGKSPAGSKVYVSDALSELWPHGFSSLGSVTFQSAAYVARYAVEKVRNDYYVVDDDGVVSERVAPFARMSNRPGIGASWFEAFGVSDVSPRGTVIVNGKECNAPRFYVKRLEERARRLACFQDKSALEVLEGWKRARGESVDMAELASDRLEARERVQAAGLRLLKRKI